MGNAGTGERSRGPSEADMELWQSIRNIYRTVLKRLNARLAKEKNTFSRYSVLIALSRAGPRQMNRLGEHMLVAPANVTGLIDGMSKKGYVQRRRDLNDPRLYVVEPTDTRARVFRSISGRFRQCIGKIGSELGHEGFAVTLGALDKVRRKVEAGEEI